MTLLLEKYLPCVLGILLAVASLLLSDPLKASIATLLANPVITILAIYTGLLATALGILLTSQGLPAIKRLKTVPHFSYIIGYQWEGVIIGAIAAILSLVVLVVCQKVQYNYQHALFFLWALFVGWAFAAFLRAVYILKNLLRST